MQGYSLSLMGALGPQAGMQSARGASRQSSSGLMGPRKSGSFRNVLNNALGARSAGAPPTLSAASKMPAATKDVSDAQAILLALSVREIIAELAGKQAANGQDQGGRDKQILNALSDFDQALQPTEPTGGVEGILEEFLNTGGAVVGALNFLNSSPELVNLLAENDCKLCQYLQPRMGQGGNSQLGAIVQQLQNVLNQLSGNANTSAPGEGLSLAGIAMEGLRQVLDDQAPQGIEADPRAIPELIYIGDTKGSGARLLSAAGVEGVEPLEIGNFQLFQGPEDASNRPIQALQALLDRVRRIDSGQSSGHTDSLGENDRMLMDFLAGRLDPTAARGMQDLAGVMVQAEVREAAMAETVRQVQAMMADMAERMQGQVLMDTENMRAVMHLEPPILGRVHVTLQMQDGQMVAHIASDQSATQDFLQENESELRQGLANEEYDPEDIEIVFDDDIQRAFGLELRKMVV